MTENFDLKETITGLENEVRSLQENCLDLRGQLRSALEEISANDQLIAKGKREEMELRESTRELERALEEARGQLQ